MKPPFLFFATICCMIAPIAGLCSENIHIAPNGDDKRGNGTKEAPYASLQVALDHAAIRSQHDTLLIKVATGIYYLTEPIRITPNHTTAPLIIACEDSIPAVFYGGFTLNQFEQHGSDLWRVHIPQTQYGFDFEQLYINGERRFRAQTPNKGEFLSVRTTLETHIDSCWTVLQVALDPKVETNLEKVHQEQCNDVIFNFYHKWDVTRCRLRHFNFKDQTAFFTGQKMKSWNPIDSKSRLVIENYFEALDAPGEWFFNKKEGYLYYMPMPGEMLETTKATVPITDQFLIITGDVARNKRVENIDFRNLSFQVSGYKTPDNGNAPAQAAAPIEASVMVDFAKNISFDRCEFAHTGLGGIWFRHNCSACSVRQCHLYDLGANGLKIGTLSIPKDKNQLTREIAVDNNIIQHGGLIFPCAVGVIVLHSADNTITHNDIADFRYSGISVGWIWGYADSPTKRNKIAYNHIHHLGWGELSDMGGIYTLGRSEGTMITRNTIHHIYSRYYGGWGLYTDEGSTGITLSSNLVYACKSAGFHQHYGQNNLITNNIFARQLRTQLEATRKEDHLSFRFIHNIVYSDCGDLAGINWKGVQAESDYNCFWDTRTTSLTIQDIPMKAWKTAGRDTHSLVANPGFANADDYDFRLKKNATIRKIGFKPFDFSEAGVYGSDEWKQRALLPASLLTQFDKLVAQTEKLNISQW